MLPCLRRIAKPRSAANFTGLDRHVSGLYPDFTSEPRLSRFRILLSARRPRSEHRKKPRSRATRISRILVAVLIVLATGGGISPVRSPSMCLTRVDSDSRVRYAFLIAVARIFQPGTPERRMAEEKLPTRAQDFS